MLWFNRNGHIPEAKHTAAGDYWEQKAFVPKSTPKKYGGNKHQNYKIGKLWNKVKYSHSFKIEENH